MNRLSLYVPVYALTLLLSAALLFSVQPMFSKMILPLLGGTPNVWNTAMLFFQIMLLSGYAYAHGTTHYLNIRTQAVLHLGLLCIFTIVLPLSIPPGWNPPTDHDPTLWQLSLMAATVGGPFFILSASAPMLQRWFATSNHPDAHDPYFLYGASNLGSMTALLAYPFVIEPLADLSRQTGIWAGAYIGLIMLTGFSAALVWPAQKKSPAKTRAKKDSSVSWKQRLHWLILAFIPSSLMLGVTTLITTDIASAPLLWVLPLAIYVGTFIIAFARKPLFSTPQALTLQGAFILLLLAIVIRNFQSDLYISFAVIGLHMIVFFFSALACHMMLVESRPKAGRLTEFYLIMALGGALGGFFNAIIAPRIFVVPLEYALVLVAACFMRFSVPPAQPWPQMVQKFKTTLKKKKLDILFTLPAASLFIVVFCTLLAFSTTKVAALKILGPILVLACAMHIKNRWFFALLVAFVMIFFPPGYDWNKNKDVMTVARERNFFGVIRVVDDYERGVRMLKHGTTTHGAQRIPSKHRLDVISYYNIQSPLHDVFIMLETTGGPQRIATLGLGGGTVACYSRPGRHFDFFEIDPAIVKIAEDGRLFSFLSECNSPYQVILGDGRLTIQHKPDHSYDMVFLDAFSSDNIPVHIITREAIEIYLRKAKRNGIVLFHISNRFLDLEPVLAAVAGDLHMTALAKVFPGGKDVPDYIYPSHYLVFVKDPTKVEFFETMGWTPARNNRHIRPWTDQFSNIAGVLGNHTGYNRMIEIRDAKKEK